MNRGLVNDAAGPTLGSLGITQVGKGAQGCGLSRERAIQKTKRGNLGEGWDRVVKPWERQKTQEAHLPEPQKERQQLCPPAA